MKLLLINLAKDEDRLAASRKRFAELGLSFERLEGVNGREMSEADFQAFIAPRPRDGKYQWTRGKVGCFLSHSRAWQICAEGEDDYVAIFEDDLHISDEMPYFLLNHDWLPDDFDIIRMESPTNRIKTARATVQEHRGRNIFRVQSTSWCAGSYILSKRGAQKLLGVPEQFHHNPDRFMFCYEDSVIASKLNTYQVSPSLTIQDKYFHTSPDQVAFHSNIETADVGSTDRITLAEKLKGLSAGEIALILKKTFQGYKRIPFKP